MKKHEIIVTMDGNETLKSAKGVIAKQCQEYQLYDPLNHRHGKLTNTSTYIRGTKQINFLFCFLSILMTLQQCGMTSFYKLTTNDHRRLYMVFSIQHDTSIKISTKDT